MEKGNLQDFLEKEKPNMQVKLRIAREVASAISYLHSLEIIHRDIKLLNILLDDSTTSYLCDLGCARDDKLLGKTPRVGNSFIKKELTNRNSDVLGSRGYLRK